MKRWVALAVVVAALVAVRQWIRNPDTAGGRVLVPQAVHRCGEEDESKSVEWHEADLQRRIDEALLVLDALGKGMMFTLPEARSAVIREATARHRDNRRVREPTEQEQQAYFDAHQEEFRPKPLRKVRMVSFSVDARPPGAAEEEATAQLRRLREQKTPLAGMLEEKSHRDFQSEYGEALAKAVFSAPLQEWMGPVEGAHGVYLIFVESETPQPLPELEAVAPGVRSAWKEQERERLYREYLKSARSRYRIAQSSQ